MVNYCPFSPSRSRRDQKLESGSRVKKQGFQNKKIKDKIQPTSAARVAVRISPVEWPHRRWIVSAPSATLCLASVVLTLSMLRA